jgi:hypothetical protein
MGKGILLALRSHADWLASSAPTEAPPKNRASPRDVDVATRETCSLSALYDPQSKSACLDTGILTEGDLRLVSALSTGHVCLKQGDTRDQIPLLCALQLWLVRMKDISLILGAARTTSYDSQRLAGTARCAQRKIGLVADCWLLLHGSIRMVPDRTRCAYLESVLKISYR